MNSIDEIGFDGEVVVVTGAAQGLGLAYATSFAARGAHVVITDIDEPALESAAAGIREVGGSVATIAGDVVGDARAMVDQVVRARGRIDVVVNNAGIALNLPFGEGALVEVERLVRVHALGTVATTAAAWDALLATKGRVVNVTSGTVLGLPGSTAYATAKGGVLGFTRALASEKHSTGVRVNAVMPMARTRMFEVGGGVAGSEQDKLLSQFFPPDAVSPVVVFLGWAGSPCNGEVFEVAGTAVSRIVFASGPIVAIESPEDLHVSLAALGSGDLQEVNSLNASLSRKLAFSMDTARVAGGATDSG